MFSELAHCPKICCKCEWKLSQVCPKISCEFAPGLILTNKQITKVIVVNCISISRNLVTQAKYSPGDPTNFSGHQWHQEAAGQHLSVPASVTEWITDVTRHLLLTYLTTERTGEDCTYSGQCDDICLCDLSFIILSASQTLLADNTEKKFSTSFSTCQSA